MSERPQSRLTVHAINNKNEFLHLLSYKPAIKPKQQEEKIQKDQISLSAISKNLDLITQNLYIAKKLQRRTRSNNSTPFKKRFHYNL